MTMALHRVRSLDEDPGFVSAFSNVLAESRNQVCRVCGLGRMGHTPESKWLGHEEHDWQPIAADAAALQRADELSTAAYRARRQTQEA